MKKKIFDLVKFAKEVHDVARDKGWWEDGHKTPLECHMLMVSEIAEASEEIRNGKKVMYTNVGSTKPEGEAVELADCILRILDYAQFHKLPLMDALRAKHEYNKTRPYKHGGKLK